MFDRPGTDTALSRWLVQRNVGVTSLGQYHHLVEVKVDLAGQLQANEPGSLTLQGDLQRLLIGLAAKATAVVCVREPEVLAVARKQYLDMCGARFEPVTPVVESKSAQRGRIAKINLPPRVLFQLGVESPFAIDDSVAAADRIVLGCDLVGSGRQPHVTQAGLGQPIRFQLSARDGRHGGRRVLRTSPRGQQRECHEQEYDKDWPSEASSARSDHDLDPPHVVTADFLAFPWVILIQVRPERQHNEMFGGRPYSHVGARATGEFGLQPNVFCGFDFLGVAQASVMMAFGQLRDVTASR